jgi:hypothetical protein
MLTIKSWFSSPADRQGLIAVILSLATGVSGAFALTGPARTSAIITSVIVAIYGGLKIVVPDNAAVKGTVALADTEQAAKDAITAFATRNPAAFAAVLADLAKVAGDFTVVKTVSPTLTPSP